MQDAAQYYSNCLYIYIYAVVYIYIYIVHIFKSNGYIILRIYFFVGHSSGITLIDCML